MKNKNRLDHIVFLRAIAILLVVFAHATRSVDSPNQHMYSPVFTPWLEMTIRSYIYSFHMPLFFWISGYVFYYSSIERSKNNNLLLQIVNKIKRLVIPMYAISFLVLLPSILLFGHVNVDLLHQFKLFVFASNNDHLWFLRDLFIIFVIVLPFAKTLDSNSKLVPLLFVLIWTFLYYCKLPYVGGAIKYLAFFIIGFYWRKYEDIFGRINTLYYFMIVFVVHFFLLFSRKIIEFPAPTEPILWYITAILGVYYMYIVAILLIGKVKVSKLWELTKMIDNSSYSIYLWHVPFLYIVLYLSHKFEIHSSFIRVMASFFVGLIASIYIHYFLSNTKKISVLFGIPIRNR